METHQNTIIKSNENIRRFTFKTKKHISRTEMLLTPEQQADKIRHQNVQLIPGEQLYKHGIFDFQNKIYEHYDEVEICCPNDDTQVVLDLLTEESYTKLLQSGFTVIHLGLFLIGIIGMHRKGLGTKVMASLVDTRHMESMSRAVIGLMEADMNNNLEIVYLTPDYLVSLSTLFKHIKLVIKTKGYNMTNTELNLLITKAFTGQIAKNSRIRYTLKTDRVENITNVLGSQGIKAIPAKYYDSELLA